MIHLFNKCRKRTRHNHCDCIGRIVARWEKHTVTKSAPCYNVSFLQAHIKAGSDFDAIRAAFQQEYFTPTGRCAIPTQTALVLALQFDLVPEQYRARVVDMLKDRLDAQKIHLDTGFVGTPLLLPALTRHGLHDYAVTLLLNEDYPSWLYAVNRGATTMWEHWDGIMENGDFWSRNMNSFNHYAYGSVMGWVYEVSAGIQALESAPGFERVRIAPTPDQRLGWLEASLDTKHGRIFSGWYYEPDGLRYEIHTPVKAHVVLGDREMDLEPGNYLFFA